MSFSDVATGAILSVSALLLIAAAPLWGHVTERIGRRPVVLTALAGTGVGLVAFGFITTGGMNGAPAALGLFFVARAAQALFVGGLLPSPRPTWRTSPRPGSVGGMGLIGAAYGLGALGGAALAWRAGGSDPAFAFFFAAAFVAVGFVLKRTFLQQGRCVLLSTPEARPRPWTRVILQHHDRQGCNAQSTASPASD